MRRILFWITLGFFTLFAATAAWLWTADLGVFKPQVEKWVTDNVCLLYTSDAADDNRLV